MALSILAGIPVGQRVSGSTPVRQFNIRPSRMKRRCISLLRPAPPYRSTVLWRAWRLRRRTKKKIADGGQRPSSSGFRERPGGYVGGAPARRLPPCGPRPSTSTPALARYRDVGHARLLAGGVRIARAACRQPPPPRWRGGAHRAERIGRRPRLFRRDADAVPHGLDQQFPQMLVAGLGDAAAAWDSPLECSGHQPDPCGEADAQSNRETRQPRRLSGQQITASMPFRHLSARHVGFHLGAFASDFTLTQRGLLLVGPAGRALAVVVERGAWPTGSPRSIRPAHARNPWSTTFRWPAAFLVVDVSVPEQRNFDRRWRRTRHRLRHLPALGSNRVRPRTRGLEHVHLGDHPERQLHGQEMRVAAVRLAAAVGGGPVHLRHRADGAVDAIARNSLHRWKPVTPDS